MPASTSQRRTKPKVRRNSDVIEFAGVNPYRVVHGAAKDGATA